MKAYPTEASCHLSFHATLIFEYDKKKGYKLVSQICSKEILAVTVHCQVSDCDQALTVTLLCSKNYTVTKNVTHWDQNCDY